MIAFLIILDLFIYNTTPYKLPILILGIPFMDSPLAIIGFFLILMLIDWRYSFSLLIFLMFFAIDKSRKKKFTSTFRVVGLENIIFYAIYILLSQVL